MRGSRGWHAKAWCSRTAVVSSRWPPARCRRRCRLTTGDSPATGAGGVLEVGDPTAVIEVDIAGLVRAGARSLRVVPPVVLEQRDARRALAVIRLLREAAADGVPISWRGAVGDGVDPALLVHLTPPLHDDAETPDVAEWRRRHRPGLCYYRLGPGFVFVKDVRSMGTAARFRLAGVVERFRALESVVDVTTLDGPTRELLDQLESERLVLRLGDHATLLPNRLRRWPVPALEV